MFESSLVPVRRALLSVSDKSGLQDFARGLDALGINLISTGGTAQSLREARLPVAEVSALTGFPEIMDGRVKTLHPVVHAGLLCRRGTDDEVMQEHGISPIDLLVVNLYPFEAVTAQPDCSLVKGIEHIDIGGPAMLRAAAKNHDHVVVVCDPADYAEVLEALAQGGSALNLRRRLAAKAFAHTARYDGRVANWLGARVHGGSTEPFAPSLHLSFERKQLLRYGENPHQSAAAYLRLQPGVPPHGVMAAEKLQGKEISYNNLLDADAAWSAIQGWDRPAVSIVKHMIPCGLAVREQLAEAYESALAGDPVSAFGGIVALVGPAGAGKSSVMAKLAARWAMRHGPRDLVLVNMDQERVGASEETAALGRLLGCRVYDVADVAELPALLERVARARLVLIDTAGCGAREARLVHEIGVVLRCQAVGVEGQRAGDRLVALRDARRRLECRLDLDHGSLTLP